MKSTLNHKSFHLIICFALGYIVGCWSSVILAVVAFGAFLFYRGDLVKLNKYKTKALPILNEIKNWGATYLSSDDSAKIKVEITLQSDSLKNLEEYCAWAKIENIDLFIANSIQDKIAKDRKWNNFLKRQQNITS